MPSFLAKVEQARAEIATAVDPWRLRLERVRGKIDYDGLERVTSQTLLDLLEVPQRSRRAGVFRRVASIMAELGWTPVRVRDLTGRGYKEQVRGYYRDARIGNGSMPDRTVFGADAGADSSKRTNLSGR